MNIQITVVGNIIFMDFTVVRIQSQKKSYLILLGRAWLLATEATGDWGDFTFRVKECNKSITLLPYSDGPQIENIEY